jgi:hypothetical protein
MIARTLIAIAVSTSSCFERTFHLTSDLSKKVRLGQFTPDNSDG